LPSLYKHIKSLVPNNWKYPLWYIFKSPQRKINPLSLLNDTYGIAIYLWYKAVHIQQQNLQPITICTGIYNRSEFYVNNLIASLNKAKYHHLIELSVFDCGSTDIPNLEQHIRMHWKGKLTYHSTHIPFSRAVSFNKAVQQASTELLFICDADMSVPENIVQLCNAYTAPKRIWYPIYFFVYKHKPAIVAPQNGEWELYGSKGMLALRKHDWNTIGGLNEKYTSWGDEDTELWTRFHLQNFTIIRNKQEGFLHHWHDSFNPKYSHMNEQA
jgi:glycosyltransferase involved in cell wall biosynthesis